MGAWDVDAFGNDTASDWAYNLEGEEDFSQIEQALDKVIAANTDELDADLACEALAAAEVVARAQGNTGFTNSYTESVDTWVKQVGIRPTVELAQKAHEVIDRILTEPSELLELWKDSDDFENWERSVADLRDRIKA